MSPDRGKGIRPPKTAPASRGKAVRAPKPPRAKSASGQNSLTELPELPTIALVGKFAEEVTIIPSSYSSLVLSSGRLEDEKQFVLLPFVETIMQGLRQGDMPSGDVPDQLETIFSHTLPLENALWLTFDLLHDFRVSSERLRDMVNGDLRLDKARMAHAIKFAELAASEAARCAEILKFLNGETATSND